MLTPLPRVRELATPSNATTYVNPVSVAHGIKSPRLRDPVPISGFEAPPMRRSRTRMLSVGAYRRCGGGCGSKKKG